MDGTQLRKLLLRALEFVNGRDMLTAQVERLAAEAGVSLGIPGVKQREVTAPARAYITTIRDMCDSDVEWLLGNGPRDQCCVRFGLTRDQVAGVLAGETRRPSGNGGSGAETQSASAPTTPTTATNSAPAVPAVPSASAPSGSASAAPIGPSPTLVVPAPPRRRRTSPTAPAPISAPAAASAGGITANPRTWPSRVHKSSNSYPLSRKEYDIDDMDRLIAKLVIESESWERHRKEIEDVRCLTSQQVAGLKASYSRSRQTHA